mgnify:CR=1 FL=1
MYPLLAKFHIRLTWLSLKNIFLCFSSYIALVIHGSFQYYFVLSHRLRWILASFRSESPLQAFQNQDFKSCGVPEQWRLLSGENRTVFQNHCLFVSNSQWNCVQNGVKELRSSSILYFTTEQSTAFHIIIWNRMLTEYQFIIRQK